MSSICEIDFDRKEITLVEEASWMVEEMYAGVSFMKKEYFSFRGVTRINFGVFK